MLPYYCCKRDHSLSLGVNNLVSPLFAKRKAIHQPFLLALCVLNMIKLQGNLLANINHLASEVTYWQKLRRCAVAFYIDAQRILGESLVEF